MKKLSFLLFAFLIFQTFKGITQPVISGVVSPNIVAKYEKYEVDYIVKIVMEEYSWLSESTIRAAITSCCQSVKPPRKREEFMACLKSKLGVS